MAPPMAAYRSEVAIASVETTIASSSQGGGAAVAPSAAGLAEKRALIANTAAELDEEARRKAEQVGVGCGAWCRLPRVSTSPAQQKVPTRGCEILRRLCGQLTPWTACRPAPQTVQQLGMDVQRNPGAKLLAKMGFGTTGGAQAGAGTSPTHNAIAVSSFRTRCEHSLHTACVPRQKLRGHLAAKLDRQPILVRAPKCRSTQSFDMGAKIPLHPDFAPQGYGAQPAGCAATRER